jgi:hypothetical protein
VSWFVGTTTELDLRRTAPRRIASSRADSTEK